MMKKGLKLILKLSILLIIVMPVIAWIDSIAFGTEKYYYLIACALESGCFVLGLWLGYMIKRNEVM